MSSSALPRVLLNSGLSFGLFRFSLSCTGVPPLDCGSSTRDLKFRLLSAKFSGPKSDNRCVSGLSPVDLRFWSKPYAKHPQRDIRTRERRHCFAVGRLSTPRIVNPVVNPDQSSCQPNCQPSCKNIHVYLYIQVAQAPKVRTLYAQTEGSKVRPCF